MSVISPHKLIATNNNITASFIFWQKYQILERVSKQFLLCLKIDAEQAQTTLSGIFNEITDFEKAFVNSFRSSKAKVVPSPHLP